MQGLNVKYPEQQIAIIIIINFPPITYGLRPRLTKVVTCFIPDFQERADPL